MKRPRILVNRKTQLQYSAKQNPTLQGIMGRSKKTEVV